MTAREVENCRPEPYAPERVTDVAEDVDCAVLFAELHERDIEERLFGN